MRRKKVFIIDDDTDYREGLQEHLSRDAEVVTFKNPDDFSDNITSSEQLEDVYLIVLDFKFDTYSALDKDLASFIREDLKYRGKMVSWSLEDDLPRKFSVHLNAKLPKKLMKLYEIDQCLN